MRTKRTRELIVASLVSAALIAGCGGSDAVDPDADRAVTQFVAQGRTILDQRIEYPASGDVQITSTVLTLQPGEETGWHHHETPLYAYIMEGSLTVDYGAEGTRTYGTGEALLEAIDVSHNGTADPATGVRILVVNIGAAGTPDTVSDG